MGSLVRVDSSNGPVGSDGSDGSEGSKGLLQGVKSSAIEKIESHNQLNQGGMNQELF